MLSSRRPSTLDAWLARWGILDWFRLFWCASVFWYELASFLWSLGSCSWQDSVLSPVPNERPAHVLLIADPQVRHLPPSKYSTLGAIRQKLLDFTLKRNWFFASRRNPDAVIFMGDVLAPWRSIRSDEEYERNYNKFLDIFRLDRRIPSYFVPGNNDVGLNIDPAAARQARQRFVKYFGPLNQKVSIRNHTLVLLDAPGLVEEDYKRAAKYIEYENWTPKPHGALEFIHSLRKANDTGPTILFSHIPLHRPDTASCGPLREKGTIRRGVGPSYQNTLGKKTTTYLLHNDSPEIVFSADDKDYCDYVHVPPRNIGADASSKPQLPNVREVTLKAFSPTSEIRYPGFQLLSLATPSPSSHLPTVSTVACFLPDYSSVYGWRYLPFFFLTTLTLIILRQRKLRTPTLPTHHRRSTLVQSFSLSSLPSGAWKHAAPHPPTPFSPDWSPSTPAYYAARRPSSPKDELPKDTLRAPAPSGSASASAPTLPATPTFRATAIPRTPSASSSTAGGLALQHAQLPTGPAHLDADELEDEFTYGRYDQRQPLRVKLDRGDDWPGDADAYGDLDPDYTYGDTDADAPSFFAGAGAGGVGGALDGDEFAFTFTLNGRRRRIAFWLPLLRSSASGGSGGARALTGGARRRAAAAAARRRPPGRASFAKRIALDLVYILWPAVVLWVGLAFVFT